MGGLDNDATGPARNQETKGSPGHHCQVPPSVSLESKASEKRRESAMLRLEIARLWIEDEKLMVESAKVWRELEHAL